MVNPIEYRSNDLYQNKDFAVGYVGDILRLNIGRTFDITCAFDMLEHTKRPDSVFERLVQLSNKFVIILLPNCYDLSSRIRFALDGRLGGKYCFTANPPEDKHRWVMSRSEIRTIYHDMASRFRLVSVDCIDMKYGDQHGPYHLRFDPFQDFSQIVSVLQLSWEYLDWENKY